MEKVYRDKYHCSGCRACEDICAHSAITMQQDEEGFVYPVINPDSCVDCGACVKICPQKDILTYDNHGNSRAYGLKHKDDSVRLASTSGGAFTAIAETLYSLYPDLVIYGSSLKCENGEFVAVHERIEGIDDIEKFRGSKYIQSDLRNVYKLLKSDLKEGKHILFTGTPCQVAGIYQRFYKNTIFANLYLVDIICHAAPSPLMFNEHIKYIGQKKGKTVTSYKFRSKITGWGHDEAAYFGENIMFRNRLSQNHRDLFYKNIINRPSCDICQHAADRHLSDLTIADFWGIDKVIPQFEDNKGVSLVLANTTKGEELIGKMNCAELVAVDRKRALGLNHHSPSPVNPKRYEFWQDYHRHGYKYVLNKYDENSIPGLMGWYTKRVIRTIFSDDIRAVVKKILRLG